MKYSLSRRRSSMVLSVLSMMALTLGSVGCSNKNHPSDPPAVLSNASVTPGQDKPSASSQIPNNTDPATVATVNVVATLNLKSILEQEFLYGADLQYSSKYDPDMELYNQSLALGHIPAKFRIAGNELQLVADNKRLYPSEVNHPEMVLTRFQIISKTEQTITVGGMQSGPLLGQVFKGTYSDTHGGFLASDGKPPRDSWIRSFEFVPEGNYILQQSSIMSDDGDIGEFMESIFPRANLAPGKDFQKFKMDADDAIGASDGPAARYRFLKAERVYEGEDAVSYAQHFDISPKADGSAGTIDWYVTANITDEEIKPVAQAVEGWNRYYEKEAGVARKVMVFKGRLPKGIHMGDPRFNVINWDNRTVAGAAYESQAADPYSGKQSHSMIYMPAAWLKIGTDYWTNGKYSDNDAVSVSPSSRSAKKGMFRSANVSCMKQLSSAAALLKSGRLTDDEVKTFGVELLKQTLFHEVGHALGLAHNFKGSLSFDRKDLSTLFSTSIMDYNDFEIERGAFTSVDTEYGPLLEYDRQAISAIYNQAKDVSAQDAVVPTCNDAEADNEDGGVDPLCIRYDIEKDPTQSINTAYHRIEYDKMKNDVTLSDALANVVASINSKDISAAKTKDDFQAQVDLAQLKITGALGFYLNSSKASYSRMVRTNIKSLLQFEDSILPDGYIEKEMRTRALRGVRMASPMSVLPQAARIALDRATRNAIGNLKQAPYFQSLSVADQAKVSADLEKGMKDIEKPILTSVRQKVVASMARHSAVPFFFGKLDDTNSSDVESDFVQILQLRAMNSEEDAKVRTAAATSLMTFKGRVSAESAISMALKTVDAQRSAATKNEDRELAEVLHGILSGSSI